MATFTASGAQAAVQPKGLRVGLVGVRSIFSINTILSAGDVFQMVKVPANATPIFVQYGCSNLTPSWLMGVGDGVSASRYRSMATYSAGAGMLFSPTNQFLAPYTYSTDDTIDIYLSTITASNVSNAGAMFMNVIFSMDPGPLS